MSATISTARSYPCPVCEGVALARKLQDQHDEWMRERQVAASRIEALVAERDAAEVALAAERQRAEKLADALTALLEVPEVSGEIYWPSDRAVRDAARTALADEREEGE